MCRYCLGLYPGFTCLAEKCPSTCCAGWRIELDSRSWERFHELPDSDLREKVLQSISELDGKHYFKNRPDGRCQMLEEDGRCLIWRKAGEQALCVTCRKYPALIGRMGQEVHISMAASCPVVAEYLWKDKLCWVIYDGEGGYRADIRADALWRRRIFRPIYQYMRAFPEETGIKDGQRAKTEAPGRTEDSRPESLELYRLWKHYQDAYEIVAGCAEMVASSPELPYLAGCFDYFEADIPAQQVIKDMLRFEGCCREALDHFYDNYIPYRIYSRYLEYPEEPEQERVFRVFGEAALFYVIHFSRFHSLHGQEDGLAAEEIAWLYRLTVHSQKREEKFIRVLKEAFTAAGELADIIRPDR